MEIPERLRERFFQVTRERIDQLEDILAGLKNNPSDRLQYEAAFQVFHKIHGSAAIYGFEKMGEIAGMLEEILCSLIQGDHRRPLDRTVVDLMVEVRECLAAIINGSDCDESKYRQLRRQMSECVKGGGQ